MPENTCVKAPLTYLFQSIQPSSSLPSTHSPTTFPTNLSTYTDLMHIYLRYLSNPVHRYCQLSDYPVHLPHSSCTIFNPYSDLCLSVNRDIKGKNKDVVADVNPVSRGKELKCFKHIFHHRRGGIGYPGCHIDDKLQHYILQWNETITGSS